MNALTKPFSILWAIIWLKLLNFFTLSAAKGLIFYCNYFSNLTPKTNKSKFNKENTSPQAFKLHYLSPMPTILKLIPIAGILCTGMLLGLLDNTLVSGWLVLFAAGVLFLLIGGLVKWLWGVANVWSSASISVILLFLAFYGNANLSFSQKHITLPISSRGCKGCSKPDSAAHRPYVVVHYQGKNVELDCDSQALAEQSDSCRVSFSIGFLGLEFMEKWQLK